MGVSSTVTHDVQQEGLMYALVILRGLKQRPETEA